MDSPFSTRVAGSDWRQAAERWIAERVDAAGRRLTGEIEQPRIRPWSTQLVVPTDAGRLWFKANCSSMAFEPGLHETLAALLPDSVDVPVGVDVERGWILTADRGTTLGDSHPPTVDDWRQVLTEAATMQRVLADHGDELLAAGLPDCSPSTVPARLDRLVETFGALPAEHPAHVPSDLAQRLHAIRPALVDAVAELDASPLPTTWEHGDLHPWNVFAVGDGALRLFDFGDSQWAHAVEVMSVPFGWIRSESELAWDDVAGAYADAWGLTATELTRLMQLCDLTQPVNRTLLWWTCLAEATAEEWRQWGDAPLHHLSRVLDA